MSSIGIDRDRKVVHSYTHNEITSLCPPKKQLFSRRLRFLLDGLALNFPLNNIPKTSSFPDQIVTPRKVSQTLLIVVAECYRDKLEF
jgi:hypothetical protein